MAARLAARLDDPRVGWALLGIAMVAASAAILHAGRGLSFSVDDLYSFARLIDGPEGPIRYDLSFEFLIAPHNGHLQVGGKFVYEPLLVLFGSDYAPFRVAGLLGVLACVGLLFELARPRVGVPVALAASVLVLLCGAAWEVMLWPFDLHTTYALAFGLGALLALDRGGRRADALACLLLVASISMIEVGISFVIAAGVTVLARGDRLRRLWIVGVPLALYAIWWLWARSFEQSNVAFDNLGSVPGSLVDSLVGVSAALTGAYAHGPGVFAWTLEPTAVAAVVAALVAVGLAIGFARALSPMALGLTAALLVYWVFIGLAGRAEDSSRYMWVGAILLLLLAAELARGTRLAGPRGLGVALALVALTVVSFPAGREKLADGRVQQLGDARKVGTEYAMLELAAPHLSAEVPIGEPVEFDTIGRLPATAYLPARERVGSLAYSLDEVRALDPNYRQLADVTLANVLGLGLEPAAAPARRTGCRGAAPGTAVELPAGGALLRTAADGPSEIALARFAAEGPSVSVGTLRPGRWAELRIPGDDALEPWLAFSEAPARICPLR